MFETIEKDMAVSILGHDVYDDLQDWIAEIQEIKADYVVFVVRRSFVLVQILTNLRDADEMKYKQIEEFPYITDSAILILCDQIAEFYKHNGYFPNILLCDDILIHGRNINHLLEDIENRIKELLFKEDEEVLLSRLERAIRIFVFTCSMDSVLVDKRYEAGLKIKKPASASFSHVLSSNIAALISKSKVANASYVHSAWTNFQFNWIETDYQNHKQSSWTIPIKREGKIKVLVTYRATEKDQDQFQVVPFVFLPQLSAVETKRIYNDIVARMIEKKYGNDMTNFVEKLYDIQGRRAFYEMVSLIHSEAMLKDLFSDYSSDNNEEREYFEFQKLARNYYNGDWSFTEKFIKTLIENPIISNQTELERHLDTCISYSNYLIDDADLLYEINFMNNVSMMDEVDIVLLEDILQEKEEEIKEHMENLFFVQGMKEEVEAKKMFYFPSIRPTKMLKRTIYDCANVISVLVSEMKDLSCTMAYFLQMMDAGVLGISSNGGIDSNLNGFCQYAKPGEQSLLIQPLRNMKYIPFLRLLWNFCEEFWLDRKSILRMFCKKERLLSEDEYDKIILFLDILDNMGQHPGDWMGDYSCRLDKNERSTLIKERNKYYDRFSRFILETPRNDLIKYGREWNEEDYD